jgi:predicted naringenin-chalcone synthase
MERYEAEAVDLATEAAASALVSAACDASQISHLVTVSCSGFSAPGVDIGLIQRLNLPRDVARTHVGFMGCHGALNGLRVAAAFAGSCPRGKVLLCCVEICTIHHQYTQQFDQLIANSLFSDGAAAVVVGSNTSQSGSWNLVDQRSHVVSDSADRMSWRIGDHGFVMTLSSEVPKIIRQKLRAWVDDWLLEHGLMIEDVRGWIVHPGGPHILSACRDVLELGPAALEESHAVLAEYGNMSSPTVFFILDLLRHDPEKLPCVMLAFGPGLTIEGALFR